MYTFNQCGQFTIRSDRFNDTAIVIVYPDNIIRSESKASFVTNTLFVYFTHVEKRVHEPEIIEEIDTLSQFRTQVHLKCSNRDGVMFYTLDGTVPTRRYDNVHVRKQFFRFNSMLIILI